MNSILGELPFQGSASCKSASQTTLHKNPFDSINKYANNEPVRHLAFQNRLYIYSKLNRTSFKSLRNTFKMYNFTNHLQSKVTIGAKALIALLLSVFAISNLSGNARKFGSALAVSLFVLLASGLSAQMNNACGTDRIIDTYVSGLMGSSNNCISISNTSSMMGATVEVWIEDNDCGRDLPSSITFSAGGQTVTATGVAAEQHSGSTALEYIYRAHIDGSFGQVCISNLSGCASATSIAVYSEREMTNASSAQLIYDLEFNQNGCSPMTVNVGEGSANRNFEIRVPVHEKGDDGRTVRIEAEALRGGSVVRSASETFSDQNAGNEAALYTLDINNVPGDADQIRIKVCSPTSGGDSFGVGSVIVASPNCNPIQSGQLPPEPTCTGADFVYNPDLFINDVGQLRSCLLYTSDAADE